MTAPFVDTNVLIYLLSTDVAKAERAEALLHGRIVISIQVLNEFANVARRKLRLEWPEIATLLKDIRHFANVRNLTLDVHEAGLKLCERYQLSFHDAMIAASALDAGCTALMSEDFSNGQCFEQRLSVCNPFI